MICKRHIPILTLVPGGGEANHTASQSGERSRAMLPVGSALEALRLVRMHRPTVLVLDLSQPGESSGCGGMMKVISVIRRREPGLPVVVLGPLANTSIEKDARCLGVTAYLSIETPACYQRADRLIELLRPRDGPCQPHAPPTGTDEDMPP